MRRVDSVDSVDSSASPNSMRNPVMFVLSFGEATLRCISSHFAEMDSVQVSEGLTDLACLWLQFFRQRIGILRHEFQLATDFLIIFQNKSFVGICRSSGKISHGVTSGSKRVGQVCFEMCPSKRSVDGKKRDGIKCIKRISKCISDHFLTPQKFNMEPFGIRVSNKNRLCQGLIFR